MPSPTSQLDTSPLCPPVSASPEQKLAWLLASQQRGESSLKNGDAYRTIDSTIDIIANRTMVNIEKARATRKSNTSVNLIKRQLREVISLLSQKIKPSCDFKTFNLEWKHIADIQTKRFKSWMVMNLFDRSMKEWLQWGVTGAGWLHVMQSKAIPGRMDTDMEVEVLGPDDVVLDQGRTPLKAYATHVRKLYNLSEALTLFPKSAGYLHPMTTRPTTRAQDSRKVTGWLSPLMNAIGAFIPGGPSGNSGDNVQSFGFLGTDVEVFFTYVLDTRLNTGTETIHSDDLCYDMATGGKTRNMTWEYEVYPLGAQIPLDDAGHFEIATPDKSYLYPTRRLLIWTRDHLIYDGPNYYWHGRPPVVMLSLDKWPWEKIGYSLAVDNITPADAVNSIIRGVVDSINLTFDPPLLVNRKEITEKEMQKLDLRKPGQRVMRSGILPADDVLRRINDGGYEIPIQTLNVLNMLTQTMNHQVGVADVQSLMELQQAPSADSTDRLLQAQGPLTTDYARELEQAITEFGILAGWNFFQFDTMKKRLQLLGQDGVGFSDFEYNPANILPVHVPGSRHGATLLERGLLFGRQFIFMIVPNSIFEFTDMQDRLLKFQMWRDGRFPVDPWTIAEAFGLQNFGEPKGTTIMERWQAWQEMSTEFQAALMAKAQVMQQQMMLQAQAEMIQQNPQLAAVMQFMQLMQGGEGQPGGGGGGQPPPEGGGGRPGRKPTGGKPPHIEGKLSVGSDRQGTIAES